MRMRSPRMAPPVKGELGSVAITPTDLPCFLSKATTASTSVDLPVPGAPVKPATWPARARSPRDSSSSRTAGSRRSTRLMARARARMSPARNRLARSLSIRESLAQEVEPVVVAEHDNQAVGLLAGCGCRVGRGGRDYRGTEEVGQPLGRLGELPTEVIKDQCLG